MDIVERLRERAASWLSFDWDNDDIFDDAANEIERLREALEDIAKGVEETSDLPRSPPWTHRNPRSDLLRVWTKALRMCFAGD